MYADFIGHTDLLLGVGEGETPRERMHRALKFYLTSFHCGRQGLQLFVNKHLLQSAHCSLEFLLSFFSFDAGSFRLMTRLKFVQWGCLKLL